MAEAVSIDGARQLARSLKAVNAELPKQLRRELNTVADLVVTGAKARVPARSGAARRSIRPASLPSAVRISGGGARAPYYPWLDFGGRVGRGKSVKRPFLKSGRYVYPAFFRERARVVDAIGDAVVRTVESAGLDVTNG